MTETPAAVQAAAEALAAGHHCDPAAHERDALAALGAAEPLIRAAERERCHADRVVSAIFACGSDDCPRPFALYRDQDVTGVSGKGTVAHGTKFADGTVVLRWLGEHPSTVVWESLNDAMAVHGHDGKTRVVWLAAEFSEMAKAEQEAAAAERERIAKLAEQYQARYWAHNNAQGTYHSFADLIREEAAT